MRTERAYTTALSTDQRYRKIAVGVILILAAFCAATPVYAIEGKKAAISFPKHIDSTFVEEFKDNLSGSAWLMTTGLDPRITDVKGNPLGAEFPPSQTKVRGILPQSGGGGQGPLVPYRSPSPKFSRNILVTRDFSRVPFQTEPHLAVDPKDPEHLILGVIDYNFPGVTTYNSIDGGATWKGPSQVKYPADDLGAAGDPVIAFDRNGTAYIAQISVDIEEFTVRNVVGDSSVTSIPIARSTDGGITWAEPIVAADSHIDTSPAVEDADGRITYEVLIPFLDKPWVAIGPSKENPENDIIYVTYTKFLTRYPLFFLFDVEAFQLVPTTETSIELVKSEDGGLTWSEPVTISDIVTSTLGEDQTKRVVQGSQPGVAPDGTVYVSWVDSTDDNSFEGRAEIYVAKSTNDGEDFTKTLASEFGEIPFSPRNTFFRYWGSSFPQMSIGPDGEVYITYTGKPPGKETDDGDIYFLVSNNQGETWDRKRLNDDKTNRLQFFPSVSAGPDGTLHAMWGDMRDDPVETRYHIYYTSSEDGGETWIENARVTDFPSNPNYAFPGGAFIGDYFTIAATTDEVYMAWPDARLGEYGPDNQKIAFARKGLMPLPSIFLSPPSGPGGKDITIQGSNFQPDQDVFLEISGAVVSTVRSDPDGRFTARIFIPISGEGAHDFRAIDASGNIATGSFFMDFGFDNIQEAVVDIMEDLDSLTANLDSMPSNGINADGTNLLSTSLNQIDTGTGSDQTLSWLLSLLLGFTSITVGIVIGIQFPRIKKLLTRDQQS